MTGIEWFFYTAICAWLLVKLAMIGAAVWFVCRLVVGVLRRW